VHPNFHAAALAADGDATIRTSVADVVRSYDWPTRYTARVLRNRFVETWHGKEAELAASSEVELSKWNKAWDEGVPMAPMSLSVNRSASSVQSSLLQTIIEQMVADAEAVIRTAAKKIS
jgi:nitronate monooxygenase